MNDKTNIEVGLFSAAALGEAFRANRRALHQTQASIALRVGCRRQTIGDIESGKNVEIYTLMAALSALGKGLLIVDARVDYDAWREHRWPAGRLGYRGPVRHDGTRSCSQTGCGANFPQV